MSGPFGEDNWTLATIEGGDGPPYVARFRSTLPSQELRSAWAKLIIIKWPYEPADAAGMPARKVHAQMNAFEDAIEASIEKPGLDTQAVSITGRGEREWRYYAKDTAAFVDAMNPALRGHPRYPLELDAFVDPDWDGLAEFLGGKG